MSKLAKYRGGLAKAKNKALSFGKKESVGKIGHEVIKFGTHATLALASKNVSNIGPLPFRPDIAGVLAGGAAMMFGKGKLRALGRSFAVGAAHAVITRWVSTERISLIEGVDIPLGRQTVESAAA